MADVWKITVVFTVILGGVFCTQLNNTDRTFTRKDARRFQDSTALLLCIGDNNNISHVQTESVAEAMSYFFYELLHEVLSPSSMSFRLVDSKRHPPYLKRVVIHKLVREMTSAKWRNCSMTLDEASATIQQLGETAFQGRNKSALILYLDQNYTSGTFVNRHFNSSEVLPYFLVPSNQIELVEQFGGRGFSLEEPRLDGTSDIHDATCRLRLQTHLATVVLLENFVTSLNAPRHSTLESWKLMKSGSSELHLNLTSPNTRIMFKSCDLENMTILTTSPIGIVRHVFPDSIHVSTRTMAVKLSSVGQWVIQTTADQPYLILTYGINLQEVQILTDTQELNVTFVESSAAGIYLKGSSVIVIVLGVIGIAGIIALVLGVWSVKRREYNAVALAPGLEEF